ncbi:MAG: hypothetical protein ACR5LF_01100 [Symbiopectobacterium sp.]
MAKFSVLLHIELNELCYYTLNSGAVKVLAALKMASAGAEKRPRLQRVRLGNK